MNEILESFLIADLGNITTRVSLIDRVGQEYRLVARGEAPTTLRPPWEDVSLGLREAVEGVERATGRRLWAAGRLLTPEGEDGHGVDGFLAATSCMEPLRAVVVGLMEPGSLRSAQRAVESTYASVRGAFTVENLRLSPKGEVSELWRLLASQEVDLILMAGGTEGSPTAPVVEAAKDLAVLLASCPGQKPLFLFAGNENAQGQIEETLEGLVELKVVENLLPRWGQERPGAIQEVLANLLGDNISAIPGISTIEGWSVAPLQPSVRVLGWCLRYLAQEYGLKVMGVDMGGHTTSLLAAQEERAFSLTCNDTGMGQGVERLLAERGMKGVLGWLPFALEEEKARNRLLNKGLRPQTVPQAKEDFLLEGALARELLAYAQERAEGLPSHGSWDLIVGTGGFLSHLPHPRQAALVLLDGLQPTGICNLALDEASLLPQVGALAAFEPLAAAQLLAKDVLLNLGTAIAPIGRAKEGTTALRFKVTYSEGGTIEGEVAYGSLEVIPLSFGQRATLELRPAGNFDLGLGKRGKGATTEVEGGAAGIIIDARGRPLALPEEPAARQAKMQEWMWEAGF